MAQFHVSILGSWLIFAVSTAIKGVGNGSPLLSSH